MSCIGCVPTSENEKQTPSKGVLGDAQVNIIYMYKCIQVHRSLSVSVVAGLTHPWSFVVFVVVFTSLVFFCFGK